jgi:hypothetical protein
MKQKINKLWIMLFFIPHSLFSQDINDCFKIKYLDFFIAINIGRSWSKEKLDTLLNTNYKTDEGINRKVNFLIPLIVSQLKQHHPACKNEKGDEVFQKLKQLYLNIREENISVLNGKSIEEQLLWFREDFYSIALNDTLLPYMIFTFDDGPFYGEKVRYDKSFNNGSKYKFEFGTFIISKLKEKIIFTVFDVKKKHLWSRIITGLGNRPLKDMSFSAKDYSKSSLGIGFQMYSEGESFKILLNNNGQFKFYFHSW